MIASSPAHQEQAAGASSEQAARRLAEAGANAITEAKGPSNVRGFVAKLVHLFALLLWAGALLALAAGCRSSARS